MSRNIMQLHESKVEEYQKQHNRDKLIITCYKERELGFWIKDSRLVRVYPLDNPSKVGTVYIGKVKNVVKNLNACFVEISDGELCFLPFHEAEAPFLLNRSYDGRILQGDELLVQVQRDALKTKQAALTCRISLQGKYFVFALGSSKLGISAKLSTKEKQSIQAFMKEKKVCFKKESLPEYGCVVRTEAGKLFQENPDKFWEEFITLEQEFVQMLSTAQHRICFSCIKAAKKPYKAIFDETGSAHGLEVVTDLPEAFTELSECFKDVRLYPDSEISLQQLYALDVKLKDALAKKVWLKSGAYLVIEQTECLTTIDVNTGKMIQGNHQEETIWKVNEEAAIEAALQISLRNLSGMLIIDFINMKRKEDEERLLVRMKELTSSDKLTRVVDITALGLMELVRKKVSPSLKEQLGNLTERF